MKILFVTMDAMENNSSANIRNRGVVFGLTELGHEVDTCSLEKSRDSINYDESVKDVDNLVNDRFFVSSNPLYARFRTKKGEDSYKEERETRTGCLKDKCKKIIKTVISNIGVYDIQRINVVQAKKLKIDISGYDVIISSSDPKSAHLLGYEMWKKAGGQVPWIQYWGDPMYDDITSNNGRIKGIQLKSEEKRLLKKASVIVYTSPFTLRRQQRLYPDVKDKMCYTVQACVTGEGNCDADQNDSQKQGKEIVVGYFGNYLSSVRDLLPIFRAADSLKTQLRVCGDGENRLESTYIKYYPRLNSEDLEKIRKEVDVIVCVCNKKGTQIPGKIYYESGCQKPVIVIVDGEHQEKMKQFFDKFDRYIVCENRVDEIQNAILQAKKEIEQRRRYVIPPQMQPTTVANKILKKFEETMR